MADGSFAGKPHPNFVAEEPPRAVDQLIAEFNNRYFVVNEAGKAVIYEPGFDPVLRRRYFQRISFEDLRKLYLNRYVEIGVNKKGEVTREPAAAVWLSHSDRRQYIDGVCFDPLTRKLPSGMLNLWQGWAVKPKAGDWSLMREHHP